MYMTGFDVGGGEIYHYKNLPFTGILEEAFFANGNLQTEIQYVDGHPQGFHREYFENGQLMQESFIKRNVSYGTLREWNENGDLIYEGVFEPEPMLVLAIDVHYRENIAKAVGVVFEPSADHARIVLTEYLTGIGEYVPGEFYKRELPCILKIIEKTDLSVIDFILIDGYVYIDDDFRFGLGGHLWKQLDGRKPIIGVAKTSFLSNKATVRELKRGESEKPLFISSVGIDLDEAVRLIATMKGDFRIPDILKKLDQITKEV